MRLFLRATTLTCALIATGCGDIKIQHSCFAPVQSNVNDVFPDGTVRFTPAWGSNKENNFLLNNRIEGYLSIYAGYEPIKRNSQLYFTGTIFRVSPSVAERYLGGSQPRVLYKVRIRTVYYVIPEHEIQAIVTPPLESCE
ncbi:hypothetical protein [Photobacterium atrarenae]|uniref:Lipoprotein n=1 Tax=Photobacterium atrarenae TaxID=865757 RepID=A0ABY5GMA2_9GAMM|nr:hypothetical protein [Photobacterium atrarenae]UTV29682.1 hypothetical protein NNL38_21980 [Photobacterium atrarenae]